MGDTFGTAEELSDVQAASTNAAAIAYLAKAAVTPDEVDPSKTYTVHVPAGATVEALDLEYLLPAPKRPRGTSKPATVEALIEHVKRHRDGDTTTIWVHPTNGSMIAVFNDHPYREPSRSSADGEPVTSGWGDHRSLLKLEHTPEWLFWLRQDNRMVSQVEFAEHMEQGMREIVEPDGATMLELAQSFHATQSASFRSATWLTDGTLQVQYDEAVEATAGRSGQIPIPTKFTLAIAPFIGEDPVPIDARLRYRPRDGKLALGYVLDHPDVVVRDCLTAVYDRLCSEFDHVYVGEPAEAR